VPVDDYTARLAEPVSGLRIGLATGRFDQMEPDVAAAIWSAVDVLRNLVAEVREAALPPVGPAWSLIPYGETLAWHRAHLKGRDLLYSSRARALMAELAEWKAVDFVEADQEMRLLRRTIHRAFVDVDLIVQPTLHVVARRLEIGTPPDPDAARAPGALFDGALHNILGTPAISIPCGFSRDGLPIGLCVVGPRFQDGRVLQLAYAYEKATNWHRRRPVLTPDIPVPPIPHAR
jgi:aspartyl-tRNA(Asn)/glutamyl-tRNA(Gln) amidotransferase subunit A